MAIFELIEGMPGQGKSLYTARKTIELLERNKRWYQKQTALYQKQKDELKEYRKRRKYFDKLTPKEKKKLPKSPPFVMQKPVLRKVAMNFKLAPHVEKKYPKQIEYWVGLDEITRFRDLDLVWDEIATHLDARRFAMVSDEVMYFLSQHRKRGIDIYANTQDFSMVDARARIMCTKVRTLRKIIGSRDPSPTKPPIKHIWGLIWLRDVLNYKEVDPEKKKYSFFDMGFFTITKELVETYDTRQSIERGELPPLKHVIRKCEHCDDPDHECNHVKTMHV